MKSLYDRYRFFHAHCGVVGRHAVAAIALARAERDAEELDLKVSWEDEDLAWDGEGEPPAIWAYAAVYHPNDPSWPIAGLGGIGLNSWRDTYVRVVEAELLSEALAALDEENDTRATELAAELAARATFAGPC